MPDVDRNSYIGGPSAATILGVNPFETPLALWQRYTGRAAPVEVNGAMRSGMRLERAVLDFAAEELQTEVMPGPFLRHPTLPLGGHLDGIPATGQVVEAKTARGKNGWGEPGTAYDPDLFGTQSLFCKIFFICCLIGGTYLFYRLTKAEEMGFAYRYAIPTVVVIWSCIETLAKWKILSEPWITLNPAFLILVVVVFELTIVLIRRAEKAKAKHP